MPVMANIDTCNYSQTSRSICNIPSHLSVESVEGNQIAIMIHKDRCNILAMVRAAGCVRKTSTYRPTIRPYIMMAVDLDHHPSK